MARSPNYPNVSLPEALQLASTLFERFDRREMTELEAVEKWGYGALSGTSRRKLAALKHYGLLEDRSDGVAVSDRALAILRPASAEERVRELKDALYGPKVFRDIFEDFESVPTAGRLAAYLLRDKGFSDSATKKVDEVFRESVAFVEDAKEAVHGPSADDAGPTNAHIAPNENAHRAGDSGRGGGPKGGTMEYKMNLSRDTVAHFVLSGEVKQTDLWLLKSFLANAQMAVLNSVADGLDKKDAESLRKEIIDELREEGK